MLPSASLRRLSLAVLAILFLASNSASAVVPNSQNDWTRQYNSGIQALEKKQFKQAELALLSALNASNIDERVLPTLEALESLYDQTGDYESEEQIGRTILTVVSGRRNYPAKRAGTILVKLGDINCKMRRYTCAEKYFRQALVILKETCGAFSPDVAMVLSNLASVAQKEDHLDTAERLFLRSTAILEKTCGHGSTLYGLTASQLAEVYVAQSRLSDAVRWARIARGSLIEALGAEDPVTERISRRCQSIIDLKKASQTHLNVHGRLLQPRKPPV